MKKFVILALLVGLDLVLAGLHLSEVTIIPSKQITSIDLFSLLPLASGKATFIRDISLTRRTLAGKDVSPTCIMLRIKTL